jgi:hypothetical protein
MTNEQEDFVMEYVTRVKHELQRIENGQDPTAQGLQDRRKYIGWKVEFILEQVVKLLPAPLRQEVQACLAINEHVWSSAYRDGYDAAQKEASSESLQTAS